MRSLRGVGVLFSLLIAGVLGGLMAPVPSDAATSTSKPTLIINGVDVPLTYQGVNCTANNGLSAAADNYFLFQNLAVTPIIQTRGCWTVNGATFTDSTATASNTVTLGGFKLGSVSKTNRARVIINDFSTTGEDKLKLTGITFQSATNGTVNLTQSTASSTTGEQDDGILCKGADAGVTTDDCQVAVVTLINTFDNSGGEGAGDPDLGASPTYPYLFYMNIGATFIASSGTNIGNRIRLIGTVCPTWASHADNGFGCDVSNASNTYSRAVQQVGGVDKTGLGGNRVGIGNFATTSDSYHDSGVLTTQTITTKNVPATAPSPSPTVITSCRTNGSGGGSQCKPTVRLDYIVWIQGNDIVHEQASPGGCGGVCNSAVAVMTPPKRAVLWCGSTPDDIDSFGNDSLTRLCARTTNANLAGAKAGCKELNGDVECVEAQTCSGAWCVMIRVKGTPPENLEDKTIGFGACGLSPFPTCPSSDNFPIKLDSYTSGETGVGIHTISNLAPAANSVLKINVTDFGPYQLDNVVCSGGAICQPLYAGKNSSTKIGFTVTGWADTGRLFVDMHIH